MKTISRLFSIFMVASLLVGLAISVQPVTPAHAAGVVSVCDDASLRVALAGGGVVTFSCSGTITLASQITIASNTTLDGTGQSVIISGGNAVGVFTVNSGVTFNLNAIKVANGKFSNGGGIFNAGTLNVTNSTFSGNNVTGDGGGIYNNNTLNVTNSTFSGNSATTGYGGGIYNNATLNVTNSTFSGNNAASGSGGGIDNGSTATVKNTLIVKGTSGNNCYGTIGGANNLANDASCGASFTNSASINLDTLKNNGGPTQTFALLTGSSAIGAGDPATCAASPVNGKDQRGVPRDATCDIGAYEVGVPQTVSPFIVNTAADHDDSVCSTDDCTLREAIAAAAADDTITFAGDYTIPLASQLTISKNVTIDGAGHSVTVSGQNAVGVFTVNSGITFNLNNLTVANGKVIGDGGGIYSISASTLNVTNSTFSGNSATNNGGGLYNNGTVNVTNSTFSDNSATYGGGIRNIGTLTVTNSTFSGNSATSGVGGGISSPVGTVTVKNTLIVKGGTGDNCRGSTIGGSNNLANDASCGAGFTNSATILLGTLGNYGGTTETFPLLPGSAAIDAGDTIICSTSGVGEVNDLDQRGIPRNSHSGVCDIGSFESQGFVFDTQTGTPQSATVNTAFATALGLKVTANNVVEPVQNGKVTFTAPGTDVSTNPAINTATIGAGGAVSQSVTANSTAGGPYTVTASASGTATSLDFSLTNTLTTTTTALTSTLNPSTFGASVTFTATPSAGTGTVTFKDNGTDITGCVNVALSSGKADCSISTLAVGSHPITAVYSGDASYATSTSTDLTQTVNTDPANDFVITVKTDNFGTPATQFTIPTTGSGYNYNVDCNNDGTNEVTGVTTGNYTCNYATAGTYTVRIKDNTGALTGFPRIYFNAAIDRAKLLTVEQWGKGKWTSMAGAFQGCNNLLTVPAAESPDLSGVTDMNFMFYNATNFNGNIGSWDTSNVTMMSSVFYGATNFNGNIGSWNTGNVTSMSSMFYGASVFNQNLNLWNTGNVTSMNRMFYSAIIFNGNIGSWNTGKVTDMRYMFMNAPAFNKDLNLWDTSKVTDMMGMFQGDIVFNGNITAWTTSSVTTMNSMFMNASAFNQDIHLWNTGNVTNMGYMFQSDTAFNQNLGGWNVTALTSAANMFTNVILSTANYDALLNGWDAQALKPTVTFSGGSSKYCLGEAARARMMSTDGWAITDGNRNCPNRTVTFNANSGSGSMANQVANVPTALTSNTFSRTGYAFSGWNTVAGGGGTAYANGATYNFLADLNLFAQWTPTHTVTYDLNGGTGTLPTQADVAAGVTFTVYSGTAPTKAGYNFGGWNDGTNTYLAGATYTMGASNVTLTAVWNATSQTVTYNLNGGSGTLPTQANVATGGTFTVYSGTAPTKAGYNFGGWNDGTNTYLAGATYTMGASNVTLTAVWNATSQTVTYNLNGGSGTLPTQANVATSGTFTVYSGTAPTKAGYIFGGWNDGTNTYLASANYTMGTGNVTLYAQWTANNNTITFDGNGSTGGSIATQTLATGATAALTANGFTRTGYAFAGWSTTPGGAVAYADSASYTMGSGNVTLYAQWTANNNTITFDGNGSTGGSTAAQTLATGATAALTANGFTRTGYAFAGWSTTAGGAVTYADLASYTMGTGNVTLYAQWTANGYTVSFDAQGGTPNSSPVSVTFNSAYGTLPSVTRSGYIFNGWFTASTGGTQVTTATLVSTASNHTLYAQWAIGLSINDIILNEGNSGTTTFSFTVNLSAPAPTGGVTFDITTADNTATIANNDYFAKAVTGATIPAGASTYTFDVLVNGDTSIEANEVFDVNISNVANATLTDGLGQGTITNDDSLSVVMSSISTDTTSVSPIPVTVTFSDTATGFIATDITVVNGSVSNFSGSGALYTFDLIPASQGPVTADIAAGAALDPQNAGNTAAPQFKRIYDNAAPTVSTTSLSLTYAAGGLSSFTVTFSENVNNPTGDTDKEDVTNPANYFLVNKGANGVVDTVSCKLGLAGDDTQVAVSNVIYIPNTAVVTLAASLPAGNYRLFLCGTTSIVDLGLNPLNGGTDSTFDITVSATATGGDDGNKDKTNARIIPSTGFAPNVTTILPPQPAELRYTQMSNLWIEIPSQNVKSDIVGVPQSEDAWNVKWLGKDAGWLNGTAFPSWTGNSVITAHVTDSNGLPGPFANLKDLKYGDQVIIHLQGQQYIFEVRNTRLVRPQVTGYAFEHLKDISYITLITCQEYNEKSDSYLFRRVVRAVLVKVK